MQAMSECPQLRFVGISLKLSILAKIGRNIHLPLWKNDAFDMHSTATTRCWQMRALSFFFLVDCNGKHQVYSIFWKRLMILPTPPPFLIFFQLFMFVKKYALSFFNFSSGDDIWVFFQFGVGTLLTWSTKNKKKAISQPLDQKM